MSKQSNHCDYCSRISVKEYAPLTTVRDGDTKLIVDICPVCLTWAKEQNRLTSMQEAV